MNDQDEYPFARPRELEWLASRGLCDPQTAAEYVGRKLLSREAFAQACQEYQHATANYASAHPPEFLGKFTVRKPNEYPLLEIWHLGLGPNFSDGYCVVPRPRTQEALDGYAGQPPLLVCYGAPHGAQQSEGSISVADYEALLEPLKHLRVPPRPGQETAIVLDGAIIGFEVVLEQTRCSYQWHSIPPKGWEPLAQWLYGAVQQLAQLTGTPTL
jgi:hypothetical protein